MKSSSPFSHPLSAANRISIYIQNSILEIGQTFEGGFFTDNQSDFSQFLQNATWNFYLQNATGAYSREGISYRLYTGPHLIQFTTEPKTANFVSENVAGRVLKLTVVANPASYEGWASTTFSNQIPPAEKLPMASPNLAGIPNLLSYAMRLDPIHPNNAFLPKPSVEVINGVIHLVFTFRRNKIAQDLDVDVEYSKDLTNWTLWQGAFHVINPDADGDGKTELLAAKIPFPSNENRLFARLRASLVPW
ncbi:MAG: hypothetical protein NZL93_06825 [Chthoniobacterales bacterium]|nr:hypothetical protein [Chthoniobacterales bacterium]